MDLLEQQLIDPLRGSPHVGESHGRSGKQGSRVCSCKAGRGSRTTSLGASVEDHSPPLDPYAPWKEAPWKPPSLRGFNGRSDNWGSAWGFYGGL
ncbi:MAG: hypothetical protein QW196_03395 [Sulfolobales archaeon]